MAKKARHEMAKSLNSAMAGFLLALLASSTFGLIPLFTLPLLHAGYPVETLTLYRFGVAAIVLWPILLATGEKIALPFKSFALLTAVSALYFLDVLLFFHAFKYLPSGVVGTLEFIFPVIVMLIMIIFFHEQFRLYTLAAILLSLAGVWLLSQTPEPAQASPLADVPGFLWGVLLALLSALCMALYLVAFQAMPPMSLSALATTFYVMLACGVYAFINAFVTDKLVWITKPADLGIAVLLGLITAVISNVALIMAIKRIGATLTSILGALEPLTAITVGILVFNEKMSVPMALGAALILAAVVTVIAKFPRK